MLFDLFDLISIIAGVFYYITMGFGFVNDSNKIAGCRFEPLQLIGVALWPVFMFLNSLFGFFEVDK